MRTWPCHSLLHKITLLYVDSPKQVEFDVYYDQEIRNPQALHPLAQTPLSVSLGLARLK